jgi:hypothetical protein
MVRKHYTPKPSRVRIRKPRRKNYEVELDEEPDAIIGPGEETK